MRYEFRLSEILGHTPDRKRRPGIIKAIVAHTGLDRHQVAALLKNESKYIPIDALSRVCDYLVEAGYANADELPGALFAIKPEHFWELIARRRSIEICVGVRKHSISDSADSAWVVASDAFLLGSVLNGISTSGGTEKFKTNNAASRELSGHPESLKQKLVWSPNPNEVASSIDYAHSVYNEYTAVAADKALICIGSVKSNPIAELIVAEGFLSKPFESQDHVKSPNHRTVPFFFRYRDSDPKPPSCFAGSNLASNQSLEEPGIYYEKEDGCWQFAGGSDTALVFYTYRESVGRLEMVLSGFSGRATRMLARTLASRGDDFWPPRYQEKTLQIGAFIVRYEFDTSPSAANDLLLTDVSATPKIIPIPEESIAKRFHIRIKRNRSGARPLQAN